MGHARVLPVLVLCVAACASEGGRTSPPPPDGSFAAGCGVVRRIAVPVPGDLHSLAGGLAAGPELNVASPGARWAWLPAGAGAWESFAAPELEGVVVTRVPVADRGRADRVLAVVRGRSLDSYWHRVEVGVLRAGASAAEPRREVGDAFLRATHDNAVASSLNGRRAVLAVGHGSVQDPLVWVLDTDGRPMAEPATITTADKLFRCLSVIPTAAGGAVSLVDRPTADADPPIWRLLELVEDGVPALVATVPLTAAEMIPSGGTCPAVMATGAGFALLSALEDGRLLVHTVTRGASNTTEIRHDAGPTRLIGATAVSDGFLVVLQSTGRAIVAHLQGGRFIDLHLPITHAQAVVPAEPGRLLIDAERFTPHPREVWEISCR